MRKNTLPSGSAGAHSSTLTLSLLIIAAIGVLAAVPCSAADADDTTASAERSLALGTASKTDDAVRVRGSEAYGKLPLYFEDNRGQTDDHVVRPGADPGRIVLGFQGADKLEVDADGDLVFHTAGAAIRQRKPVIYQEVDGLRRDIAGGYVLRQTRTVGFKVDTYDPSRPLIIDPVLFYSTYLGGMGTDAGRAIAVDPSGNAYVTGETLSSNFPTIAGAFDTSFNGGGVFGDAFVTKVNPTGSGLVYSTYLGGIGDDNCLGIAGDGSGNAYVTGLTRSTDFPVTRGAFQTSYGGGTDDVFVTKLNSTGSALLYSTYLGGSAQDIGNGIAVDTSGSAYVTGVTRSCLT